MMDSSKISTQISRQLGVDAEEIETRWRFLEFDANDIARLKQVHSLIEDYRDEFSEKFYTHLLQFSTLQQLLADPSVLARLKRVQAAYFSSLTDGDYDSDYIAGRLHVGEVHQRIGLGPKWYLGAYRKYLSYLLPLVWRAYAGDRDKFVATYDSMLKIVMFDIGLALDAYFSAGERSILRSNEELEAFSYSVSHDLRAPLRAMDGFSQALLEDYGQQLDEAGKGYLKRIRDASQRMAQLIDDILKLSRVSRSEIHIETVDMSALVQAVAKNVRRAYPGRDVEFVSAPGITVRADARLLRMVMENLLDNAWKFTSKRNFAHVEFGATLYEGKPVYFVRDDGAGFDPAYTDKLFVAFQRLHAASEFPGTGIGLATAQRIISRHGGRVWAKGEVEKGATFYFTLS